MEAIKVAKIGFMGTVLAALIAGGVALYIHLGEKGLQSSQTQSNTASKTGKSASVNIKDIQVTPVSFDMPGYFYIEIENNHLEVAQDVQLTVDFGAAKIEKCSFRPNNPNNVESNSDSFSLKIKIVELMKNESFYAYCLISEPVFNKVLLSAENDNIDNLMEWPSYLKQRGDGFGLGGWAIFFSILGGILIVYLFICLLVYIHKFLFPETEEKT